VKGTNIGGPGWVWAEQTLDNFTHIVKWKFNTIRLATIGSPTLDSQTTYTCSTPQYKYSTYGTLRQIIKKYTDAKIVVLIEWHAVGGIYTGTLLECVKDWFAMLANDIRTIVCLVRYL
jgi:aryl-phospho-beta-D-glucosidase BglC (GH1 family)